VPREPHWWYRPPGLASRVLGPAAHIYGAIATRRLTAATPYRSRLPVICVGNFTAGGSGKTPVAVLVVQRLMARGERPAILTRGYGGSTRGPHWVDPHRDTAERVGDEPLLLVRHAPVLVAGDRRAGAQAIEVHGGFSVIVMDDGLQNPALAKDLAIAVVDGARGVGNGCVIPAGPLRAPLAVQLPMAKAIVFNGAAAPGVVAAVTGERAMPILRGALEPSGDVAWLRGARVVAFAGIGNPARFFDTLRGLGASVVATVPFPDHARFAAADARRLIDLAARHDARLITTEKDHVRLAGNPDADALARSAVALPVAMTLTADAARELDGLLDEVLRRG
jgi:tetraacyldisaccharide 4'-kinase